MKMNSFQNKKDKHVSIFYYCRINGKMADENLIFLAIIK